MIPLHMNRVMSNSMPLKDINTFEVSNSLLSDIKNSIVLRRLQTEKQLNYEIMVLGA